MELLFDLRIWLAVLVFAVVEVSVNLAKYYAGRGGMTAVQKRFPKTDVERWERNKIRAPNSRGTTLNF